MLNFQKLYANKPFKYFLFVAVFSCLVYIVLRLTVYSSDPLFPLLNSLLRTYLYVPEWIANLVFKSGNAGVIIKDQEFIFESKAAYHIAYSGYIENWPRYLLIKKLSALLLVLIWATISPIRKKIRYSLVFIITHMVSVAGGLYSLGVIYPRIIDDQTDFFLSPNLTGTLAMFILLVIWVMLNKKEIRNTLQKLVFNISLSDRKINEIIVLLFFLLLLSHYFIPFHDYKLYVHFLLEITRRIASIFSYDGYIDGDQLIGENGALALAKHCLGFTTMYVFASLVYLTRPAENRRRTWWYIIMGLIFLFVLNLVRLILVFIVAQGENGFERAEKHHEIYNVVIYVFIFALWVVWYEFFILKARKNKVKTEI